MNDTKARRFSWVRPRQTPVSRTAVLASILLIAAAPSPALSQRRALWHLEHERSVDCVAISPDSKVVATGGGRQIRLWSLKTGKELRLIKSEKGSVSKLFYVEKGKTLLAVSWSGIHIVNVEDTRRFYLTWYDPATGKKLREMEFREGIEPVALSPDGKTLATCSGKRGDCAVKLRNPATGEVTGELHPLDFHHLLFTPDSKQLVIVHSTKRIEVHDIQTKKEVRQLKLDGEKEKKYIVVLGVTPDGKSLVMTRLYEADTALVDIKTGVERWRVKVHGNGNPPVLFARGGKWLLVAGAARISVLDPATGEVVLWPAGAAWSRILDMAISPDEKWVVTADGDNAKVFKFSEWEENRREYKPYHSDEGAAP